MLILALDQRPQLAEIAHVDSAPMHLVSDERAPIDHGHLAGIQVVRQLCDHGADHAASRITHILFHLLIMRIPVLEATKGIGAQCASAGFDAFGT